MLDKFFTKQSPILSLLGMGGGIARRAATAGGHVEVLFAQFNDTYEAADNGYIESPTLVLTPDIQYLYVLGTGGGGGGGWANSNDNGRGGGGGAGSIRLMTGYSIPGPSQGSPIKVRVGDGGKAGYDGGTTQIRINDGTVLQMNYGSAGAQIGGDGGTVSAPGLSRLPAFPSNNEATGGAGGQGGERNGSPGQNGNAGPNGGCGGGGGGGAHVSNKPAGNGGQSGPGSTSYNVVQQNQSIASFANPYPITISGTSGGAKSNASGGGEVTPGGDVLLAQGGGGHGADGNTGSSAGAGAGIRAQTPDSPSPAKYRGGGGGGVRGYIQAPLDQPVLRGWGGGGFIIVVGSSYELVSGVDY